MRSSPGTVALSGFGGVKKVSPRFLERVAVTGLDGVEDEREGAEPRRNWSELRQTEALIGAEAVDARTDEGRDGLGAASGTRLARAQVLVRRIGIGSLCDAPVGGSGPDQRGQQRTQERPERP